MGALALIPTGRKLPLSDRVRLALNDTITSTALAELIDDTRVERENVQATMAVRKATAVDPLSSDAAAAKARSEYQELTFDDERLGSSVARLEHRLKQVEREEADAKAKARLEAAERVRDALVADLRDRYPVIAAELVELLRRVQASNAECRAAGLNSHGMAEWIAREGHTRMYGGTPMDDPISLLRGVNLPAFTFSDAHFGYLWFGRDHAD